MGKGSGCRGLSSTWSAILDSKVTSETVHSFEGGRGTFFANFFAFFCFCADAFSILCRSRTGWRLDFGSTQDVSAIFAKFYTVSTYFRPSWCVAVVVVDCHLMRLIFSNISRNITLAGLLGGKAVAVSVACSSLAPAPRLPTATISQQRHISIWHCTIQTAQRLR